MEGGHLTAIISQESLLMSVRCHSRMTVFGSTASVDAFAKKARGKSDIPLTAAALLPIPDDIKGYDSKMEWVYANWGCRSAEAYKVEMTPYGSNLLVTYSLESANGPPTLLVDRVAADFPELTFGLRTSQYFLEQMETGRWRDGTRMYLHALEGDEAFSIGPLFPFVSRHELL